MNKQTTKHVQGHIDTLSHAAFFFYLFIW